MAHNRVGDRPRTARVLAVTLRSLARLRACRVGRARRVLRGSGGRAAQHGGVPPRSPYDNLVHPRTVKKPVPAGRGRERPRRRGPELRLRRRRGPLREGRRPPRGPLRQGARLPARPRLLGRRPPRRPGAAEAERPRPVRCAAPPARPTWPAPGRGSPAQGRIYVEGKHDAELVEKVWGHDLRDRGRRRRAAARRRRPARRSCGSSGPTQGRRLGVLVDHLVRGSKESRIAEQITGEHALVVGHPFIDIWQAVKPSVVGIKAWPTVPEGRALEGQASAGGWAGRTTPATSGRSASSPACRACTDLEPDAHRPGRGTDRLRHDRLTPAAGLCRARRAVIVSIT